MTNKIYGTRVTVPEFEIFSNPTISIADITQRRFNIIDRSIDWTKHFDYLMNKAIDNKEIKSIFMRYINQNGLRAHVKITYSHLIDTLDKLLVLK